VSYHASVRRARRERGLKVVGYLVTWDVNSRVAGQAARVRRFVFGERSTKNGKTYVYEGFLRQQGVRYVGQSVLFVPRSRLMEIARFLMSVGVEFVVTQATLGRIVRLRVPAGGSSG
jgi:hypothetical protein